ncbi:MAG: hypothetical protein CSYNP_00260 [Syntrophus sp. SKADARSKE-3]|nr:hypothetical protein [Syntrophus sp. SKADARSKE-3]
MIYKIIQHNKAQNSLGTLNCLTTKYMAETFNPEVPRTFPEIESKSYAGSYVDMNLDSCPMEFQYDQFLFDGFYEWMKSPAAYSLPNSAIPWNPNWADKDHNDGLVPVEFAKMDPSKFTEADIMFGDPMWNCAKTKYAYPGCSHFNEINQFFGVVRHFDVPKWYVNVLLADLIKRGL